MSIRRVKTKIGETKWEVSVYEKGRDSRRIRRRFDRKTDAEVFMVDYKAQLRNSSVSGFQPGALKERVFGDEVESWLRDGKLRFSPGHIVRVEGILRELLPQIGNWTLDKFTPEVLARIQQEASAKGLKNETVNRRTDLILAVLNFSVKQRRIPFNPAHGFKKLRPGGHEMLFWNRDEAESFLSFASKQYPPGHPKRWVYAAYLLALNTGIRAGELWGLKVMDVSADARTLMIRRQFNRVSLEFTWTKGKKQRLVPCNPALHRELKAIIEQKRLSESDTIFSNELGKPICHDNFSDRQFMVDVKAWGGRKIRFHDLRHTATTQMIQNGVDIRTVQEICGHADIKTTMNYVHMVSGNVERVALSFSLLGEREEGLNS